MSKFQVILLSVFGFFILVAVMMFALYKGGSSTQSATVTIWGELPAEAFYGVIGTNIPQIDKGLNLTYVEKSPETITSEFTEALASGTGPDLIITTQDKFLENRKKLIVIPYESISARDFTETFIEESSLLLGGEGVYGLPLLVDPMVLYYNRDILSSAGIAQPIAYWDEIYANALKLTQKDQAGNLSRSAIALGEARNISNFKEILSLLLLQAGTPITGFLGSELRSMLPESYGLTVSPAESAVEFYTQFANPSKPFYSWNRTMPDAQTHFISGDSAYYLGFASERRVLANKNPNLNFGVASVPQSRVSGKALTFGRLYSISLTRGTRDPAGALRAALVIISQDVTGILAKGYGLPPARRDLLSQRQTDAVTPILYESAVRARGWLDPDSGNSRAVFRDMIEAVLSGRARTLEAISSASERLDNLIKLK